MNTDPGLVYLATAYASFFAILAVFMVRLQRRERALWTEVESLERRLEGAGADS